MAETVMAEFCPAHRFLGLAELPGHRLAFTRRSVRTGTGVADAVPAEGSSVWGVLYELSDSDVAALDRKEGQGWAYERRSVTVRLVRTQAPVAAVLYRVRRPEPAEVAPSRQYLEGLFEAAQARGLPAAYIKELQGTARQAQTV